MERISRSNPRELKTFRNIISYSGASLAQRLLRFQRIDSFVWNDIYFGIRKPVWVSGASPVRIEIRLGLKEY